MSVKFYQLRILARDKNSFKTSIVYNRVGEKGETSMITSFSSSHTTERTLVLGGFSKISTKISRKQIANAY